MKKLMLAIPARHVSYPAKLLTAVIAFALCGADWLQFRGTDSNSVAREGTAPVSWNDSENIAWKADLTGRGPSSPIVVGPCVVVTSSSGNLQDRLHIACFDVATGRPVWRRQFWATGRSICHPQSANAAPTPASDGERVFAFYSSGDLFCLDLEGNVLWLRGLGYDFPKAYNDVGMASSPAVFGDVVVVQMETQGESFAAGLDAATGLTRWRLARQPEAAWTSPIAMRNAKGGRDVVLLQSAGELSAHDPATGKLLWTYKAACESIASAVATPERVFVPASGITALRPDGDKVEVEWKATDLKPGAACPVVFDGRLYVINRAGVLACAEATNGKSLWKLRIPGSYWATPALVEQRLYCINSDGATQIVALGDGAQRGKIIGTADLHEKIQASPAVADGAIYIRSDEHLWKIMGQ